MVPSISEAARRGAAEFDRHKPGWALRINRATLDMRSMNHCIGTRVFGSYAAALAAIDVSHDEAHMYGFDVTDERNWNELTEAWLTEVDKRQR